MKILMVNDYKEIIGGAEVYMYSLKKELENAGHEVRLFTTNISKKEYTKRAKIVTIGTYFKRIFNVESFFQFRNLVIQWKPDVIHIHSYNELSPAFLYWANGIKVVMTIHDQRIASAVIDPQCSYAKRHMNMCPGCMECVGLKGMLFEKVKNFVYRFFTKSISTYIVPSRFLLKQLKQFENLQPIAHLYNGFQLPTAKPPVFSKRIVYAGRLVENKGIQFVIEAMKTVCEQFPETKFEIIGSGDYEKELKDLVNNYGLSSSVIFFGSISHESVIEHVYKAEVAVIPSIYDDNLPTIGLESLGAGRVIVATNIGGLPEIVDDGKNGYLIEPKKAAELSKKIVYLFSHPEEVTKMAAMSHKKSSQFDIKVHLEKILVLYKN